MIRVIATAMDALLLVLMCLDTSKREQMNRYEVFSAFFVMIACTFSIVSMWVRQMIKIEFVNGDEETVELSEKDNLWIYDEKSDCFVIDTKSQKIIYPKAFVKSIRYLKL